MPLIKSADFLAACAVPDVVPGTVIPRTIHQVWHDKRELSPALRANIDAIGATNPHWRHHLYDVADMETFIARHYGPAMLAVFHAINPEYVAARADFFRYLLIYAVGGVYLDMKSSTRRSLDECLRADDRYLLSHWDNGPHGSHPGWGLNHRALHAFPRGEYQQWFIAAAPGHPFLKAVIERVIANIREYRPLRVGVGQVGVLSTTGPIPYSLAIEPIRDAHPHRLVDAARDLGLVYSIYDDQQACGQHRQIFKRHYTRLVSPVVSQGRTVDRLITIGAPLLKKLRLMRKKM